MCSCAVNWWFEDLMKEENLRFVNEYYRESGNDMVLERREKLFDVIESYAVFLLISNIDFC